MSNRTNLVFAGIGAALAVAAVGLVAQGPPPQVPSTTKMVLKGRAPVSSEILKVKLPRPKEADLPNGLHLMVLEDRRLPQVTFQILIPGAGGYFDPAGKLGLASYTAALMIEGTKSRTSTDISGALETMAATLSINTGFAGPQASVFGSSLSENFDKLFDLTADVLLNPAFSAEEWDRLKARTKTGLTQQRANPGFLANETFNRVVFGAHPAGRVSTTAEMLDAITPASMVEFHQSRYVPGPCRDRVCRRSVAGRSAEAGGDEARRLEEIGAAKPQVDDPPAMGTPKVSLIARPGSVQTTLYVGTQSMKRIDEDYTALTVANRVLGGTMGRLFRHLREEKGYTYGIGSGFSATLHRGAWSASTSVRTEVTEPALTDLLAEIAEMRDKPVPAGELQDSKRAIVAGFALSLENPQQVLGYYIDNWLYGLPPDYWDTYPARVTAVTAEQAQAAARKYLEPGRLQIVAVGDAAKIADILKKKGTVEMFDAEGKAIGASQP